MRAKRAPLITVLGLLLVLQSYISLGFLYPQWRDHYQLQGSGDISALSGLDQLLSLFGFRELIAGVLWVRADTYFNEGNYDAVLPIIRVVTILDPRQLDVYATGMWHLAYNFTDEDQRSDRRYIPSAVALGKEGMERNDYTYELFFETGWLYYHKIVDDFHFATKYFEEADKRDDHPPIRRNLLAQVYQRDGKITRAMEHYRELLADAQARLTAEGQFGDFQQRDTIENNLDTLLLRMSQRGYFARQGGYYDQWRYDTQPPFDVGFSAQVTVEQPRVLLVQGTWNVLPVGTRIRFIVRDADWEHAVPAGIDWDYADTVTLDPPRDVTFLQDQLFVRNKRFSRRIDMSRNPTMYPFRSDEYVIEFFYDSRSGAIHIQDKFGWDGEGMTDQNYLREDIKDGYRVIYAKFTLTRDQILRRGEWAMGARTPSIETVGYRAPAPIDSRDEVIEVPGLLSEDP